MSTIRTLSIEGRAFFYSWVGILSITSLLATALVVDELYSSAISGDIEHIGLVFGFGLDAAKLSLTAMLLVALWRKEYRSAGAMALLAVPLMVISIALNVTFMSDSIDRQVTDKTQMAHSSSLIAQEMDIIDQQIQGQRNTISAFQDQFRSNTKGKFRQVNLELGDVVADAENRIERLLNKRSELTKQMNDTAPADSEITIYGLDQNSLDLIILGIAILIDLASVGGSAFLYNDRLNRADLKRQTAERQRMEKLKAGSTPSTQRPSPVTVAATPSPAGKVQVETKREEAISVKPKPQTQGPVAEKPSLVSEEHFEQALDLVFNQGVPPKILELRNAGMTNHPAKNALKEMFNRGILTKNGSGHYVIAEQ